MRASRRSCSSCTVRRSSSFPVPTDAETGTQDQALLDSLEACTSGGGEPIPPSADGLPFSTATVPGEGASAEEACWLA